LPPSFVPGVGERASERASERAFPRSTSRRVVGVENLLATSSRIRRIRISSPERKNKELPATLPDALPRRD